MVGTEIYIVGAGIARPFFTVSSALPGRADAINVLVRSQNASEKTTDGRPYELNSVPTKTVAIRTTEKCSDLVQKLCLHRVGNGLAHSDSEIFA